MKPSCSSRLTLRRQGEGERPTCSASWVLLSRPSVCSAAMILVSMMSSVAFGMDSIKLAGSVGEIALQPSETAAIRKDCHAATCDLSMHDHSARRRGLYADRVPCARVGRDIRQACGVAAGRRLDQGLWRIDPRPHRPAADGAAVPGSLCDSYPAAARGVLAGRDR